MGLSLLERRIGAVTLSPKASSHAACVGKMENGKFEAVCGVAGRRLDRWRGMIFKPSAATETAKNGILKNGKIRAHGRAGAHVGSRNEPTSIYLSNIKSNIKTVELWKSKKTKANWTQ